LKLNDGDEVIVAHLGVTDRDVGAEKARELLSKELGCPVIALPSYAGDVGAWTTWHDVGEAGVQYVTPGVFPVGFEEAWRRIVAKHKIRGVLVHSGAGIRFNTERQGLVDFVKKHPDQVSGPIVFLETYRTDQTKKDFASVGMPSTQIGKMALVPWVLRPAASYIRCHEMLERLGLGPIATLLGLPVKAVAAVPAVVAWTWHHSLDDPLRLSQIKKAFLPATSRPKRAAIPSVNAAQAGGQGGAGGSTGKGRHDGMGGRAGGPVSQGSGGKGEAVAARPWTSGQGGAGGSTGRAGWDGAGGRSGGPILRGAGGGAGGVVPPMADTAGQGGAGGRAGRGGFGGMGGGPGGPGSDGSGGGGGPGVVGGPSGGTGGQGGAGGGGGHRNSNNPKSSTEARGKRRKPNPESQPVDPKPVPQDGVSGVMVSPPLNTRPAVLKNEKGSILESRPSDDSVIWHPGAAPGASK